MLTIRHEQFAALGQSAIEDFRLGVVRYLAHEYPLQAAALGTTGLRAHVDDGLADAQRRGFNTAGAIGIWIELRLQFGDELQRSPDRRWAHNILDHAALPDYVKLALVRDRLTAQTGGRPVVTFDASTSQG